MKNENLIVQGKEAKYFLDNCEFTEPEQFTHWEVNAYEAYDNLHGKGASHKAGINNLTDLFGEEFEKEFFHKKYTIITDMSYKNIQKDIEYLEETRRQIYNLYKKDFIGHEDYIYYVRNF